MQRFKVLVLTDHTNHSAENSLYPLVHAMKNHPRCVQLDVATRGGGVNDLFFKKQMKKELSVCQVEENFAFHPDGRLFRENVRWEAIENYDVVWLRMPPPLSDDFLEFLACEFPGQLFINDPRGIQKTGDKRFLMEFPELCPPMKICSSAKDITDFKNRFPIVLKPFREYGGRGIVKIDGEQVWEGNNVIPFSRFLEQIEGTSPAYLGVQFLKNVTQGDKRIVVINGQIMGASLRLPPEGAWICNVAMGGRSIHAEVAEEEKEIIERISPVLTGLGIVMYGVDTLVGEDGRRVLSEINTTSIGGLPQMAKYTGKPLLQQAAELFWNYINSNIRKKNDHASRRPYSSY